MVGKAAAQDSRGHLEPNPQLAQFRDNAKLQDYDVLTFDDAPLLNPQNWPKARKAFYMAISLNLVICSTNASSLASGVAESAVKYFRLHYGQGWVVLPTSIFLVGYFIGNLTLSPLSERFGSRKLLLGTTTGFLIWMMACALAPTWAALNIFRLLNGYAAAGASSSISGICANLYGGQKSRGRALLSYNVATSLGPVVGPIMSGWANLLDWRWAFWLGLIYGGISLFFLLWLPETNHQMVLAQHAQAIRNEACALCKTLEIQVYGNIEVNPPKPRDMLTKVIFRPAIMFCTEPLVFFSCLSIAFQYSVFYMFFQSYSIIFVDMYYFNTGEEGLTFLAYAVGVLLAIPVQLLYERIFEIEQEQGKPWTRHHGARRLPQACMAGPLIATSLFWSAWTARTSVHWIVPTLASLPYGLGYTLNFNALLNYLIDGYPPYAASCNGASMVSRQMMAAGLPFATRPMYRALGIDWASSTLGFIAIFMASFPFGFWIYGEKILNNSKLARSMSKG